MSTFSQTIVLHNNPSANVIGTRGSGPSWTYGSGGFIGPGWRCFSGGPSRYFDVFFDPSSITDGATIQGLTLSVRCDIEEYTAKWYEVGFTKDGSTRAGDDKAANTAIASGATKVFGGSADLWGTTWTTAELKAGTFRPFIRIEGTDENYGTTVKCHTITLAVEYSAASASGNPNTVGITRRRR